ncbi:MAG TPA: cupin domain-containing protein [Alicyclobacillus sp.]|nr:cupin domain-containing protein [Alicyclobacillus sp.]
MTVNREYFREGVRWDGEADYEPGYHHLPDLPFLEAATGVKLRPLFGCQLMFSYVTFEPNAEAPIHQHPQEQMSLVLQGRVRFDVGGNVRIMGPGDAVTIPANVPHGAVALEEGAVCLDAFAPPREGFKELMERQSRTQRPAATNDVPAADPLQSDRGRE